jgi:predicted DNA-binding protein
MKRTTVFLDEALLRRLKQFAYRRGVSCATVVREAVAAYVAEPTSAGVLPSVAGRYASGKTDTAERAEELLWTDPHA